MKKYKLTKDLGLTRTGGIFDIEGYYYGNNINELIKMDINEEVKDIIKYADYFSDYFQEVFELKEQLPKFKVGDYYVKEYSSGICAYKLLREIEVGQDTFIDGSNIKNTGYIIRKPTEEELKKYFR